MSKVILDFVSSRQLPYYGDMNVKAVTDEGKSCNWLPSFRHKALLLDALIDGMKVIMRETPEGEDLDAAKEVLEELEFIRSLDMQF